MTGLISLENKKTLKNEPEVEVFAMSQLQKAGYELTMRSCKNGLLKKHWPSKTKSAKGAGYPDILLHLPEAEKPICVWENKGPAETAQSALKEAQFYIEGLRKALPSEPALPYIAVGYNGAQLCAAIYTNDSKWVSIKVDGSSHTTAFLAHSICRPGSLRTACSQRRMGRPQSRICGRCCRS